MGIVLKLTLISLAFLILIYKHNSNHLNAINYGLISSVDYYSINCVDMQRYPNKIK